jgi:hypothetical protein
MLLPVSSTLQPILLVPDNESRLHISASDVVIMNISFLDLVGQLQALRHDMQVRDQQVADLLTRVGEAAGGGVVSRRLDRERPVSQI